MSLYDGLELEVEKDKTEKDISGWSSGIKLLQSQLQLKKTFLTQTKILREPVKKGNIMLPPVIDLKSRKLEPEERIIAPVPVQHQPNSENRVSLPAPVENFSSERETNVIDEYDPFYPNDYEKIIKDQKERKEKEREEERRKEYEERRRRNSERYHERDEQNDQTRNKERRKRPNEEEEELEKPKRATGAAIAPPSSLLEDTRKEATPPASFGANIGRGGSVALKIMAKYGFKEGQGLGKQEQGMSQALQVEKTSKRGGKIIHERDVPKIEPPMFVAPAPVLGESSSNLSPQNSDSITEAMKNPSKVVLLRNMVGPGEVDDDLEPEVKDECSKYGDVAKCVIFEIPHIEEEEAVRIFVEFKRIESAIKAVVDLNGRYFGGRIVRGGFYNLDKFRRLDLGD